MKDPQKKASKQTPARGATGALTAAGVFVWTLSSLGLLVLLRGMGDGSAETLGALDVELPGLTAGTLAAGEFVGQTTGLLIAGGGLVVTVLPFVFGARGATAAKVYGSLALLGVLAVGATFFAVQRPLEALHQHLDAPAPPGR